MADLRARIAKYLLLVDPVALDIVLGVAKAQDLPGDPPWLMLVGPPSGTKTEMVSLLEAHLAAYALSDLSEQTLASGMTIRTKDETTGEIIETDPSLLARLDKHILLLKDFTTVLSMHKDKKSAILAQLREIYDGKYDRVWGTGKELHWRGRLGFVAGVTDAIDSHHVVMGILGPRFVLLRLQQPNRQAMAKRAMRNGRDGARGLRTEVACFLHTLPNLAPTISEDQCDRLAELADFVTRARSAVERSGRKRELISTPAPEMPARFARALLSLVQGVAVVRGHHEVQDDDMAAAVRVGLDSLPPVRRYLLGELASGQSLQELALVSACGHQWSRSTIARGLEDLESLGLIEHRLEPVNLRTGKAPKVWHLRPEWRTFGVCSEISGGLPAGVQQGSRQ